MRFLRVIWDTLAGGNIEYIEQHDLTPEDVECVLLEAVEEIQSNASGRSCVFGETPGGDCIIVVFEWIDESTVLPVTAYEVPDPRLQQE